MQYKVIAIGAKISLQREIRSMERASAQCVAFRMPKQVVMY